MKKENESVIQEKFKTLIGGQALSRGHYDAGARQAVDRRARA